MSKYNSFGGLVGSEPLISLVNKDHPLMTRPKALKFLLQDLSRIRKICICFLIIHIILNFLSCKLSNHYPFCFVIFYRTILRLFPSIQRSLMLDQGHWWLSRLWWMCLRETLRMRLVISLKLWLSAISNLSLISQRGLRCRTGLSPLIGREGDTSNVGAMIVMDEASEAFESRKALETDWQ